MIRTTKIGFWGIVIIDATHNQHIFSLPFSIFKVILKWLKHVSINIFQSMSPPRANSIEYCHSLQFLLVNSYPVNLELGFKFPNRGAEEEDPRGFISLLLRFHLNPCSQNCCDENKTTCRVILSYCQSRLAFILDGWQQNVFLHGGFQEIYMELP